MTSFNISPVLSYTNSTPTGLEHAPHSTEDDSHTIASLTAVDLSPNDEEKKSFEAVGREVGVSVERGKGAVRHPEAIERDRGITYWRGRGTPEVEMVLDPDEERRLRRKLDFTVLPIFALTYMFLFLDRSNIGNAKQAGLVQDLGLRPFDFNIGTSSFYLIYLLFELPFGLLIKRLGTWVLPVTVICFGVGTIGSAFMKDRAGFYVLRLYLGVFASGGMPGISYLLTRYYRRQELTYRMGFFMVFAAGGAGGFGGLVAAGLLSIPTHTLRTSHPWQNIYLVQGIITTFLGIILLIIFPRHPEDTKMLNARERAIAEMRILIDQPDIVETKEPIRFELVKRGFLNPTIVCCVWLYIADNVTVQGLGIFLPSILSVAYPESTSTDIQLMVVPLYVCASGITLIVTYLCTKYRLHWPFCLFGGVLTLIGYGIWTVAPLSAIKLRYAACFLNLTGGFINGPVVMGWAASNASPDTVRAMVGAVVSGIGTTGSIAGVWAYVQSDAATGYHKGNSFNLAMSASLCSVCIFLAVYQKWENRNREKGRRDYRLQRGDRNTLGNLHPSFKLIQ